MTGFRLDCRGTWLGEDNAVEWLVLDFQATNSIPGDGLIERWVHSLQRFANGKPQEIATILDRVPLDKVNSIIVLR